MDANPASDDLYERLGISPTAKPEEVRKAFKAMRRDLHPDGKPESLRTHFNQLMQNVNEANQTLLSPTSRAKYDAKRTHRAQTQESQRDAAREQAEHQRREEARSRAEQQRHEAEARERQQARQRAEEERRREEEARVEEEDWDWSEEPEETDDEDYPRPDPQPGPVVGSSSWLVKRVPGPIHRAAIYVSGSWVYLACGFLVWHLPIYGASVAAILLGFVVSITAGLLSISVFKLTSLLATVTTLIPSLAARMLPIWFSRRVLESFALAPVVGILSLLLGPVWVVVSLASFAYVALWIAEAMRWRAARKSGG